PVKPLMQKEATASAPPEEKARSPKARLRVAMELKPIRHLGADDSAREASNAEGSDSVSATGRES
ncbi:hypothetical protein CQA18_27670, partial [Enterobacter hormaechei]|uniref:hypothetical protein n=1 Tax=Enterobacter hormaechei TaxID=158836 RepID=UPI000BD053CD